MIRCADLRNGRRTVGQMTSDSPAYGRSPRTRGSSEQRIRTCPVMRSARAASFPAEEDSQPGKPWFHAPGTALLRSFGIADAKSAVQQFGVSRGSGRDLCSTDRWQDLRTSDRSTRRTARLPAAWSEADGGLPARALQERRSFVRADASARTLRTAASVRLGIADRSLKKLFRRMVGVHCTEFPAEIVPGSGKQSVRNHLIGTIRFPPENGTSDFGQTVSIRFSWNCGRRA